MIRRPRLRAFRGLATGPALRRGTAALSVVALALAGGSQVPAQNAGVQNAGVQNAGVQNADTQRALWERPTLGFTGVPGIVDMPTAHAMRHADLTLSLGAYDKSTRLTAHFQITPRLSGVFRYVWLDNYEGRGDYYDRSFDLRYLLMQEGVYRPAVSVGLQDFGGTGIFAGEYLVATKTFGRLRATGGIGWGRFGSYNGFTNPLSVFGESLETRPDQTGVRNQTGRLDASHWFKGDAAFFGGLEYQATDRLRLAVEYSSDAYVGETRRMGFDRASPVNFGATYRFDNGTDLRAAWLYGSTVAVQLNYTFNPKAPSRAPRAQGAAPLPVGVRAASALGWTMAEDAPGLRDRTAALLSPDGLTLDGFAVQGQTALVRFRNPGAMNTAQAVGRVARALSRTMPGAVERFEIVPVSGTGIPASRIVILRSDLEELEHAPDGAWQSFARARIEDAPRDSLSPVLPGDAVPSFDWGLGPFLQASYFDPDSPVRLDFGVEAHARWEPRQGTVIAGQVRQRLGGNRAELIESDSEIRHVRSDSGIYAREGETALSSLTVAQYFRPGADLYGRMTVGYLEPMYAGISGELLWKPVQSRLALGAEVNYVAQRDFDQRFGLQDYEVATGHVSAYYAGQKGFHYQLDMGRYLAGDWGGTLSVDREFNNGIRIGAFATLTDVPFEEFGEGSFDKGVRVEIPISAITGQRSSRTVARTIRPVLRDGGARLEVGGRLYESVREWHEPELQDQWGRFWR